jgi:hypothetical protein
MELDNLVTQDLANEGVWTPIVLYGKPRDFDLLILGDDSDKVQQYNRKALKKLKSVIKRTKENNDDEFDDDAADELAESGDEGVLARIAGIRGWKVERKGSKEISRQSEPVTLCGIEFKNSPESYKLLIEKVPALKDFVLKVARDRTNFLSGKSGN